MTTSDLVVILQHVALGTPVYLCLAWAIRRFNRRKGRCYYCARRRMPRFTELAFHSVVIDGTRMPRGTRVSLVDPLDDEVTVSLPFLCDTVTIRQWPVPPRAPDTIAGEAGA